MWKYWGVEGDRIRTSQGHRGHGYMGYWGRETLTIADKVSCKRWQWNGNLILVDNLAGNVS